MGLQKWQGEENEMKRGDGTGKRNGAHQKSEPSDESADLRRERGQARRHVEQVRG